MQTARGGEKVAHSLTLGVLEVMSPQRSDLILTSHIPHCEAYILILNCLYIKTCKTRRALDKPVIPTTKPVGV